MHAYELCYIYTSEEKNFKVEDILNVDLALYYDLFGAKVLDGELKLVNYFCMKSFCLSKMEKERKSDKNK